MADLRSACAAANISLDVMGAGWGQVTAEPERILAGYDLVFALGRSALEAMSVGCGVVIWGLEGLGGFVHAGNFSQLAQSNFGRRALCPVGIDELLSEIQRYDHKEIAVVQNHVRENLSQSSLADRHLALYHQVIDEAKFQLWKPEIEFRLAAQYLKNCEPLLQKNIQNTKEARRRMRKKIDWSMSCGFVSRFW